MNDYRSQFLNDCLLYTEGFSAKSVLVVGCGTGEDCLPFVEAGAIVSGLDITDEIGKNFMTSGVKYYRGSIEGCVLESASFDLVFSIATMEHVHNIQAGFREMARLTKPGGLIYSMAAPLWHSRTGHHLDRLSFMPWIHLRLTSQDILAYCHANGIQNPDHDIAYDVEFMFSDYFNRLPSWQYLEACRGMDVQNLVRNDVWCDGAEELTPEILAELEPKGYTRGELLGVTHRLVARR